jgi:hypothetical protein
MAWTALVTSVASFSIGGRPQGRRQASASLRPLQSNNDDGQVGTGPNWIERSFPVDTEKVDTKRVEDYNLGISGVSFGTGPLSARLWEAIQSKSSLPIDTPEIAKAFRVYAMDFTAKEAVRAALKQNGMELALQEEEQDQGIWGGIDSIRILDEQDMPMAEHFYDSWEEAVDHWSPGQAFHFVARQVPAKMRELSMDELLQALDPKGELRSSAKEAGMYLPDEGIRTLADMANENTRRTEMAPREASDVDTVFAGTSEKRGYRPIMASALSVEARNNDGSENRRTVVHAMDAMVSHGCLVVDLTNGGTTFTQAVALANLWKAEETFFDPESTNFDSVPGMETVQEAGSQHAKVGFASYHDGNMQFLETRLTRSGDVLPKAALPFLGEDAASVLTTAFSIVTELAKDIVRIATAASLEEMSRLEGAAASEAALLLANELSDNGKSLGEDTSIDHSEAPVSMSPLRLCRYSNKANKEEEDKKNKAGESSGIREIFGAHTDSTFITAVPVAAVAGLEVYDEEAEQWYRPELLVRRVWQAEREAKGLDPEALEEEVDGQLVPWYARYIVMMPGELLQLVTRQEILATVHRVVAVRDGPSRLSAPILLRCRPGTRMNVERYLGGFSEDYEGDEDDEDAEAVLSEADGMTVEEIHDAMQPPRK